MKAARGWLLKFCHGGKECVRLTVGKLILHEICNYENYKNKNNLIELLIFLINWGCVKEFLEKN